MSHSNVDPAELAKFSELAHRWWDPESEFRPLHQINPLRLGWIQQLCPLAGKRVVDGTMLKAPVLGDILRKIAVARFCRTLATLISSGVPE